MPALVLSAAFGATSAAAESIPATFALDLVLAPSAVAAMAFSPGRTLTVDVWFFGYPNTAPGAGENMTESGLIPLGHTVAEVPPATQRVAVTVDIDRDALAQWVIGPRPYVNVTVYRTLDPEERVFFEEMGEDPYEAIQLSPVKCDVFEAELAAAARSGARITCRAG